jgi:hypothetical protein
MLLAAFVIAIYSQLVLFKMKARPSFSFQKDSRSRLDVFIQSNPAILIGRQVLLRTRSTKRTQG